MRGSQVPIIQAFFSHICGLSILPVPFILLLGSAFLKRCRRGDYITVSFLKKIINFSFFILTGSEGVSERGGGC